MDLFYRVSVTSIHIPPLRERQEDIQTLVDHFLRKFSEQYGVAAKQIKREVITALENHAWPGNVRDQVLNGVRGDKSYRGLAATAPSISSMVGAEDPVQIMR